MFYCFYELTFPTKKRRSLSIMALIKREILSSLEVLNTKFCTRTRIAPVNREIKFTYTPNLYHVTKLSPYFPFTLNCFYKNKSFHASFNHRNRAELFLSAYFLF